MTPHTDPALHPLSHFELGSVRCSGCSRELSGKSVAETYDTPSSHWISVKCPDCGRWTPLRLEGK